jgi:tRNA G18 (ribose-2'-O)-methylase SpoU
MAGAASEHAALIERFRGARSDPAGVVLEGFHALKHAIRFGAAIEHACAADPDGLDALARELAPDVAPQLRALAMPVPAAIFARLAPAAVETGVIAIARRPEVDVQAALEAPRAAPVVLLEAPARLGNIGAVVRVAAAAGAAAVLTTGTHDPWHPAALRGSAGLHFALPVARIETVPPASARPLWAIDPEGEPVRPGTIPDGALLAFGSERRGLSEALLAAAERRIAIPMRAGVSSLNLASAVAVILYLWRLGAVKEPARQLRRAPG